MTEVMVRACSKQALDDGRVHVIPLPRGDDGKPREALLILGSDGRPRAYLNRCRHLPIPIDCGSREFLSEDGEHLLCMTHGALFRRDDGQCVAGPCQNLPLFGFRIVERDGELFVML